MMGSDLVVYLVVSIVLILMIVLLRWRWRHGQTGLTVPKQTRVKREPKPFAGYTHKPECELCDPGIDSHPQAPGRAAAPHDLHPRPSSAGRYHRPFLPAGHLFLPRLGQLG